MVYRIFVEKKPGFDHEAHALLHEINSFLGITNLTSLRVINRYDVENIEKTLFDYSVKTVFSEPQLDIATSDVDNKVIFKECLFGIADENLVIEKKDGLAMRPFKYFLNVIRALDNKICKLEFTT